MSNMPISRKSSNFSHAEMESLATEVEKRQGVIYGRLSSVLTAKMKVEAWEQIAICANSQNCGDIGTAKQLRKKWSDMMSSTKRKEAAQRREI